MLQARTFIIRHEFLDTVLQFLLPRKRTLKQNATAYNYNQLKIKWRRGGSNYFYGWILERATRWRGCLLPYYLLQAGKPSIQSEQQQAPRRQDLILYWSHNLFNAHRKTGKWTIQLILEHSLRKKTPLVSIWLFWVLLYITIITYLKRSEKEYSHLQVVCSISICWEDIEKFFTTVPYYA